MPVNLVVTILKYSSIAPIVFVLVWRCAIAQDENPVPTVEEIESRVIHARNEIRSAIVEIDSRVTHGDTTQSSQKTIYIDHERWRTDFRRPYAAKPDDVEEEYFVEITCFGCAPEEERLLFWSTEQVDTETGLALAFYDPEYVPERDQRALVNLRVLGLAAAATSNTGSYSLELLFGEESRLPGTVRVVQDQLEDEELVRVSFNRPNGAMVQYWTSPKHGYGIVRYEIARGDRTSSVECGLVELVGVDNLWYPHTYRYERVVAGQLTRSEEATIRVTSLNEPIDDEVFSLEGIHDLKPGTGVYIMSPDHRPRGQLEWNGSEIARAPPVEIMMSTSDHRRPTRLRVLLWGNLGVLFLLLSIWLFRKLRQDEDGAAPAQ